MKNDSFRFSGCSSIAELSCSLYYDFIGCPGWCSNGEYVWLGVHAVMLDTIAERLREDRLEPAEVTTVATEILAVNAKGVALILFRLLNREPSEDLTSNLLDLFRELAVRSPMWANLLDKSVRKRGRCPRQLRSTIRELLSNEDERLARTVPSVRQLISDLQSEEIVESQILEDSDEDVVFLQRRGLFRSYPRQTRLRVTTALTNIQNMERLASALSRIEADDEVVIDLLAVDHTYVFGLAAMATWLRANSVRPRIENASDRTLAYLDEIGFTKAFAGGAAYTTAHADFSMALEPIDSGSQPENIATKLADIIDHQMSLSRKRRSGLIVLFSELVENILRHSGPISAAYACAQVYPSRRKLSICIVDRGMGVRQSFLGGQDETLVNRVAAGESAMQLACSPLVTSKPDRHSGYGLYVASELVVRNGGTFRIFSGGEILTRYGGGWHRKEHMRTVRECWPGTWIAMIVDLNKTLSIDDVYVTLPPPPGMETEDFF